MEHVHFAWEKEVHFAVNEKPRSAPHGIRKDRNGVDGKRPGQVELTALNSGGQPITMEKWPYCTE